MFAALVMGGSTLWIPILLISILIIAAIFATKIYRPVIQWLAGIGTRSSEGNYTLDEAIEAAGYSYDPKQDIFYSNMDAWQRDMGFCRLYDEASVPLGMIIDCEPIEFEYDGKRWLIEFWKGQYDLTTGGEIGIYTTKSSDINIPGIYNGPFYRSAGDEDVLSMSFSLKKKGKTLLTRQEKHWWLTGFKLGEFSEPSELTMDLSIILKDKTMCDAFVKGLTNTGYSKDEISINGNKVALRFDKPHTVQPITRTPEADLVIQIKNKLLCDKYQEITAGYDNFPDKIKAIKKQAPKLYENVINRQDKTAIWKV
jgi:hypothetical protein